MGADCRHSKRRPQEIVTAANQVPGLVGVFSLFNTRTPKVYADIDRVRAEMLGVTANRVFETLQVYLGSSASGFSRLKRRRRSAGADDASNGKADRREEALRGNPPEIARGIEAAFAAEAGSGPIPAGRRPSFWFFGFRTPG